MALIARAPEILGSNSRDPCDCRGRPDPTTAARRSLLSRWLLALSNAHPVGRTCSAKPQASLSMDVGSGWRPTISAVSSPLIEQSPTHNKCRLGLPSSASDRLGGWNAFGGLLWRVENCRILRQKKSQSRLSYANRSRQRPQGKISLSTGSFPAKSCLILRHPGAFAVNNTPCVGINERILRSTCFRIRGTAEETASSRQAGLATPKLATMPAWRWRRSIPC